MVTPTPMPTMPQITVMIANLRTTPPFNASDESVQTETDTKSQEEPATQVLRISDALQSAAQIHIDFHSILLDIVEQDDEKQPGNVLGNQVAISQSKSFRILLSRIISPNAP